MTDPRDSPAPGWYEDPQTPAMLRWWDGGQWTNDIRPMNPVSAPPVDGSGPLRPVSDWMTETFRLVVGNAAALFTLIIVLVMPASLISSVAIWGVLRDTVIEFGDTPGEPLVEVTGFGSPVVFGVAVAVNLLLTLFFGVAGTRMLLANRFEPQMQWAGALRSAAPVLLPYLGWFIVATLIITGLFVGAVALTALLPGALAAIVGLVAFLVAPVLLYGRFSMIYTTPMVAARGARNPLEIGRITKGRWAGMLGRTLLLALVGFTAYIAGSVLTGPFSSIGGAEPFEPGSTVLQVRDLIGSNVGLFTLIQLIVAITGSIATVLWHCGMAVLFEDLGGRIDENLRK